ncbi:MAG TPA: DUF4159 domain-containing protein [Gemmatimonadaceae bacterium]|jgi:hypothetical protein
MLTWIDAGVIVGAMLATAGVVDAQRPGRGYGRYLGSPEDMYQPPAFHGNVPYDGRFTFARIRYRGYEHFTQEGPGWSHDYPDAEENFTKILRDVTAIKPFVERGPMVGSVLIELSDSSLFKYPVTYMSEPGGWHATDKDISNLRSYLMKGGFMIFDDFREDFRTADFTNLRYEMGRALPGAKWVQLTGNEPIFDSFFKIDLKLAVNRTSSYGANLPSYWGVYQDNDPKKRLLLIANVDNDIGESWEYSASGFVPIASANEIYKLGINYVIYALTH